MHALDRTQQVDTSGRVPPTIAGGLHEMPALEPALMMAGWRITAEATAFDLKTEKLQPTYFLYIYR